MDEHSFIHSFFQSIIHHHFFPLYISILDIYMVNHYIKVSFLCISFGSVSVLYAGVCQSKNSQPAFISYTCKHLQKKGLLLVCGPPTGHICVGHSWTPSYLCLLSEYMLKNKHHDDAHTGRDFIQPHKLTWKQNGRWRGSD